MKIDFYPILCRSWASVAVGGASLIGSGLKLFGAHSQDKQAAREGAALKRPMYQIQPEYQQNVNIGKQLATEGFTDAQKTYLGEQRERGLESSLESLGETGGGPNQFAELAKVFNDSLTSEAAQDAQLHLQNINFFTQANKDLAGQKNIQWGVNELQPYESKLKEIQDRRTAAQTNESNAWNDIIGSGTAIATGVNSYMAMKPPKAPPKRDLGSYSIDFGLADVGATPGIDPASQYSVLNPLAASNTVAGF